MGKIAPTIVALGKSSEDEYRKDLHKLCQSLQGNAKGNTRGLFFGNTEPKDAIEWFGRYEVATVPKTGFVATETFIIRKGALDSTQFNHSQEYQLRQLGLLVQLKHGQLLLERDFVSSAGCWYDDLMEGITFFFFEERNELFGNCKFIKFNFFVSMNKIIIIIIKGLWDQKQAKFRIVLHGYWSNDQFVTLNDNQNEAPDTNEQDEEKFLQDKNADYDTFGNTANDQIGRSNAFFEKLLKGNKGRAFDDDEDDNDNNNDNKDNEENDNEDGDDDGNEDNNDNKDEFDITMKESNTNSQNGADTAIDDALFLESD
ncbi:hypothetical protein RFI_30772 [Reticulomyxa filosa]|uniref:Uncharacterized protein n=1 Tax=Reticulomyxa filosa TaxID=46433 RepID=X6LYB1_RETFI|nr:hypothetical protein RFI_30772 [Reticulomyxa filosa]|eukprot:ETO06614.1 hypothetical protein RFI_30772 [Reticulomyxa filosa]